MMSNRRNSFGARLRVLAAAFALLFAAAPALAQTNQPVTVTETFDTFTMDNGIIQAVVSKRTGDLVAMTYKGVDTITPDVGGHSAIYWSHDTSGGKDTIARISIDPRANGGERAEVSVKGISGGNKMGHGPGTAVDGDIQLDIDTRWSLGRGESGVYTYMAFDHRPEYGSGTMAEARIAVELARWFDHIHVDDMRTGKYPLMSGSGADKYVYVTRQADERASGWTSSTKNIGWFQLNPSAEYLSGGPNKAEFTAHGDSAVLNYWKSSHYGGSNVTVIQGERWNRVVGPFMFYVNEGPSHEAMVADAKAQLKKEEAKWPYAWVDAEGFAKPAERGKVTGQFVLDDRLGPFGGRFPGKIMVGLTKTPYDIPAPPAAQAAAMQADGRFSTTTIQWQNDGKFLQFWSRNDSPDGRFTIDKVAPGQYTLHAFADGVVGEYSKADITVPAGGAVDLGRLTWTPVRNGRQVWEIGAADRDAREFAYVERYFEPGSQLKYRELFPNGVNFRIGQSTTQKDWFFAQTPTPPAGATPTVVGFSGIPGQGEATPYNILFSMPAAGRGAATLCFAFTHSSAAGIEVAVNGAPVGVVRAPLSDNAITRHQIYGRFSDTAFAFDAALLKAGENTITLTVPAGPYNSGVIYDYIRLELDEAAPAPPKPAVLTLARPNPPAAPAGGPGPGGPGAGGPRPAAAAPPQMVFTHHDDARLGLATTTAGTGAAGAPQAIAGVERLGPWAVSPDGKLVAYAQADSDAANAFSTIRVVDAATGAPRADEVRWARQTAIAWMPDSKSFFYSGLAPPAEGASAPGGFHLVFEHALGEPRANDKLRMGSDRFVVINYAEVTADGRYLVVNGSLRADGKSEISLLNLTEPKPAPYKAMRRMQERWQFAGSNGSLLYFVTDYGAERGRIVSIDVSKSGLPIAEVVPQGIERLQAARYRNGKFDLAYGGGTTPPR